MKSEIKKNLQSIVDSETAEAIFNNLFPEEITGYKAGDVLTVGSLKKLPPDTVIHLLYHDDDGNLRNDDLVKFCGYDGDDELCTTDGFTMPIEDHTDDEFIQDFDNCGWTFTVRKAIKI